MFTGLIETVGKVLSLRQGSNAWVLDVEAFDIASELRLGESVSILGACSTIIRCDAVSFGVEIMEETRRKTKLGSLKQGDRVNLERAMRLDSRLDGHIVTGHIDGLAVVSNIKMYANTREYFFNAPEQIILGIVPKGSVTIDGVSLTVIDVSKSVFSVGIIPATLAGTTLAELKNGDTVNIETDILGKYITRFLEARFNGNAANPAPGDKTLLTWDKLAELGWL